MQARKLSFAISQLFQKLQEQGRVEELLQAGTQYSGNYQFAHEIVLSDEEKMDIEANIREELNKEFEPLVEAASKSQDVAGQAKLLEAKFNLEYNKRCASAFKAQATGDDIADAKLMPRCIRTAYSALIGAALREAGSTKPLFDTEDDNGESTYDPLEDGGLDKAQFMTYEQGLRYAEAVMVMATSYSRHDRCNWLFQMDKREILRDAEGNAIKDADGNYQVLRTTTQLIKPVEEWIVDQKAQTPDTSLWFISLLEAQQLNVCSQHTGMDVAEAKEIFTEWLNEVPWTRDSDPRSRRERIVEAVADSKYKAYVRAITSGKTKDIDKAVADWNLMVYSPMMARDIRAIKKSEDYRGYMLDIQIETDQEDMKREMNDLRFMQLEADRAERQLKLAEMRSNMDKMMAGINERLAKLTPSASQQIQDAKQQQQTPTTQEQQQPTNLGPRTYKQGQRSVGIR